MPTKNDTHIWMENFLNVDIGSPLWIVINCTKVEPYNINNKHVFKPSCVSVSTMSNSSKIDGNNHILHIQKMNIECLIFDNFMYRGKKNLNEKLTCSLLKMLI